LSDVTNVNATTAAMPPLPKVGIAYRLELASWVTSRPPGLDLLEITAEHFYRVGSAPLRRLAASHSLIVQTSRLSLGTPGPLDASELDAFERVVTAADPLWICEHLGFRRGGGLDLGGPVPLPLTTETLTRFIEHAREAMTRSRKRLLLGNVASHVRFHGNISEPDFLNRFCAESGGGVVVDLASLVVNGRNHGYEPRGWIGAVEPQHIVELRVGGLAREEGRWIARRDGPVDEEVWDLLAVARDLAPAAVRILVREENFPPATELAAELQRLTSSGDRRVGDAAPRR
jgi:uncharacterized protein (UPF0276 family)